MKKIVSIVVSGRSWFRRSAGNSYQTAHIFVTFSDGTAQDLYVQRTNGYGDYYALAASELLCDAGLIDNPPHANGVREPLWSFCRKHNIAFSHNCNEVSRQRDLHN